MNRWIAFTSGKGGVGKSFAARLVAEWKRELGRVYLVDGDGKIGQLYQYLATRDKEGRIAPKQSGESGVIEFSLHDWRDESGKFDVYNGLLEPLRVAQGDVLFDLPAASLDVLRRLESESGLSEGIARLDYRPTLVVPIAPTVASCSSVADALDLGPGYDVVAVRSEMWGGSRDYRRWIGSRLRHRLFERGGKEIAIPKLEGWIAVDLDEHSLPFRVAAEGDALEYPDDELLRRWVLRARAALAPAAKELGITVAVPEPEKVPV